MIHDSANEDLLKVYRQRYKNGNFPQFDVVGITTLFTFYWKQTVDTINYAKKFCAQNGKMLVGGIAATILPEYIYDETGIRPYVGLLDQPGALDKGNTDIIDELKSAARRQKKKSRRSAEVFSHALFDAAAFEKSKPPFLFYLLKE